jgi:hypothetical protein
LNYYYPLLQPFLQARIHFSIREVLEADYVRYTMYGADSDVMVGTESLSQYEVRFFSQVRKIASELSVSIFCRRIGVEHRSDFPRCSFVDARLLILLLSKASVRSSYRMDWNTSQDKVRSSFVKASILDPSSSNLDMYVCTYIYSSSSLESHAACFVRRLMKSPCVYVTIHTYHSNNNVRFYYSLF